MLLLAALSLATLPQDQPIDRATLVILEGDREVGRQTYSVRQGQLRDGTAGYVFETRGNYGSTRISSRIILSADWRPRRLQLDLRRPGTGGGTRITGRAGRGRFVIRETGPDTEGYREHPVRYPVAIVADSVFAFYALVAYSVTNGNTRFTAIVPGRGRRARISATDHGVNPTTVGGVPISLRHIELNIQGEQRHVWIRPDGGLVKVEVPARNLVVERLARGN